MTSNPITCKHLLNHILGSMTQMSTPKCAAVIPFFVLTQTYFIINWIQRSIVLVILQNSPNCMIWQFFFGGGGRCPEFPYQAHSCKIIISLSIYIYNNIICEIFSNVFFFVIMLVCLRIGAYVHTGQKIPASERQILYIPLAKITSDVLSNKQIHI